MKLRPLRDRVFVTDIERGERHLGSGIIIPNDDGKNSGIRPRWARILAIGKDIKDDELEVGKWVLLEHGRWTREIVHIDDDGTQTSIWQADYPDGFLAVSDEKPGDTSTSFSEYS